jgi:5-hydroxyisourate hydrolase-like protein (transthyretin family)
MSGIGALRVARTSMGLALVAALVLGLAMTASAVTPGSASISGVVSGSNHSHIPSVVVSAFSPSGDHIADATTDGNGAYSITGLEAAKYKLRFASPDVSWSVRWLGNATRLGSSATLTLVDGQARTGINATLPKLAAVTGTVRLAASKAPVPGATVGLYNLAGTRVASTETASDGTYAFRGLRAGLYTVEATDEASSYANAWLGGGYSTSSAHYFPLASGSGTSSRDISMVEGGELRGRVTDYSSVLPGVKVYLARTNGEIIREFTNDDYGFDFPNIVPGKYILKFDSGYGGTREYSGYVDSPAYAQRFSVAPDQVLTVPDHESFTGANAWGIEGIVELPSGAPARYVDVTLTAVADGHGQQPRTVLTDNNGQYDFPRVYTSTRYAVTVHPGVPYVAESYKGKFGEEAPTQIHPTSSDNQILLTPIVLHSRASVTVSATEDGNPASAVTAEFFDAAGARVDVEKATSDSLTTTSLPGGTFRVRVTDPGHGWAWLGGTTFGTATPITVADGEARSISVTLGHGTTVSGIVEGASSGKPLDSVAVQLYSKLPNGTYVVCGAPVRTDGVGHYAIPEVAPGSYRLRLTDDQIGQLLAKTSSTFSVMAGKATLGVATQHLSSPTPVLQVAQPVISGSMHQGQTVTAVVAASYPATGVTYHYTWRTAGFMLPYHGRTLKLLDIYAGFTLTVTVTASKNGYTSVSRESVPVMPLWQK